MARRRRPARGKEGEQLLLASGKPLRPDIWHTLKLSFRDDAIRVSIDGKEVADVRSERSPAGMVGLGGGWHDTQFDNLYLNFNTPTNLALGKPATASSQWNDEYAAARALDGDTSTRWNAAAGKSAGEWIEVDLGKDLAINRTVIQQFGTRISAYRIQYQDGADWKDAHSGGVMNDLQTDTFPAVSTRRVRLLVEKTVDRQTPSVIEFQVFPAEPR